MVKRKEKGKKGKARNKKKIKHKSTGPLTLTLWSLRRKRNNKKVRNEEQGREEEVSSSENHSFHLKSLDIFQREVYKEPFDLLRTNEGRRKEGKKKSKAVQQIIEQARRGAVQVNEACFSSQTREKQSTYLVGSQLNTNRSENKNFHCCSAAENKTPGSGQGWGKNLPLALPAEATRSAMATK